VHDDAMAVSANVARSAWTDPFAGTSDQDCPAVIRIILAMSNPVIHSLGSPRFTGYRVPSWWVFDLMGVQ